MYYRASGVSHTELGVKGNLSSETNATTSLTALIVPRAVISPFDILTYQRHARALHPPIPKYPSGLRCICIAYWFWQWKLIAAALFSPTPPSFTISRPTTLYFVGSLAPPAPCVVLPAIGPIVTRFPVNLNLSEVVATFDAFL
jgi:hypothetical protein